MQNEWESYDEYYERLCSYSKPNLDNPLVFYETYAKEGEPLLLESISLYGNNNYCPDNFTFTFYTSEGDEEIVKSVKRYADEISIIEKHTFNLITNYLESTDTQITNELRRIFLNKVLNSCLNLVIRSWKSDETTMLVFNSIRKIGNEVVSRYKPVYPDLINSFLETNKYSFKIRPQKTISKFKLDCEKKDFVEFLMPLSKCNPVRISEADISLLADCSFQFLDSKSQEQESIQSYRISANLNAEQIGTLFFYLKKKFSTASQYKTQFIEIIHRHFPDILSEYDPIDNFKSTIRKYNNAERVFLEIGIDL